MASEPEMSSDISDPEWVEELRNRVINKTDSLLWSYKAHYEAADSYSKRSKYMDWITTFGAALLTVWLIWQVLPRGFLVGLAILTAVASGYKTAAKPHKKSEKHYYAGDAYHSLFDEFRDFICIEINREDTTPMEIKDRFEELSRQRKEMNREMPNIDRKWYDKVDESIYEEIETTEEAERKLTKVARKDGRN